MAIPHEHAYGLAARLKTIPGSPQGDDAIDALADDLVEFCRDEEEARWLVREARVRWEKWAGTAGLAQLLESRRPSTAPERKVVDMGPKPPVLCARCEDWGYVNASGHYEFCECAQGDWLRAKRPDLCEKLNAGTQPNILPVPTVPAVPRRPITQADVDDVIRDREQKAKEGS